MAFLHSAQLLYTDCGYPRWSVCFTLPNAIFFYMLFNDFYKKSYKKPSASHRKSEAIKADDVTQQQLLEPNNNTVLPDDDKKTH